jgi:hypothetical protein
MKWKIHFRRLPSMPSCSVWRRTGLREVAHDIWNMSTHIEHSVSMARREFLIGFLGVGIAECSI